MPKVAVHEKLVTGEVEIPQAVIDADGISDYLNIVGWPSGGEVIEVTFEVIKEEPPKDKPLDCVGNWCLVWNDEPNGQSYPRFVTGLTKSSYPFEADGLEWKHAVRLTDAQCKVLGLPIGKEA